MSIWKKFMGWFWGDLKEEPVEVKKTQPKVHTTTDEVLEEAVKKTLEKTPDVKSEPEPKKQRTPRKRKPKVSKEETEEKEVKKAPRKRATKKPAEKPATKKPRKPRKKKESNAD